MLGVPYQTVMGWLREGRIPEAEADDSNPRGRVWWIPETVIERFKNPVTKPKKGRPRKNPDGESGPSKDSKVSTRTRAKAK
jgi:hypothetical protein